MLLIGPCLIIHFCIVGYADEAKLDELSAYPVFIQFIETNSAYLGFFFIIVGSAFLIGGRILGALDKIHKHVAHHTADLTDQMNLLRGDMLSLSIMTRDRPRPENAKTPSIEIINQPAPTESHPPTPIIKTRHLRIWPFN